MPGIILFSSTIRFELSAETMVVYAWRSFMTVKPYLLGEVPWAIVEKTGISKRDNTNVILKPCIILG